MTCGEANERGVLRTVPRISCRDTEFHGDLVQSEDAHCVAVAALPM